MQSSPGLLITGSHVILSIKHLHTNAKHLNIILFIIYVIQSTASAGKVTGSSAATIDPRKRKHEPSSSSSSSAVLDSSGAPVLGEAADATGTWQH